MRLLLVSHCASDPNGGASRVYHFLTEGLAARGHEVECLHLDDVEIPHLVSKIAVRCFLPSFVSRTAARVVRRSDTPFDVIFSSSGMLSPLYKRIWNEPARPLLVNHLHGLCFFYHQSTMAEAARGEIEVSQVYRYYTGELPVRWDMEGVRHSDLSIVQNVREEDFLRGKGFQTVKTIPLAVHPEVLAAGETAPKQNDRDAMTLLWSGSWIANKGAHYLPRAFERICERFPQAQLTIGGSGKAEQEVVTNFKESLRKRIRVLPKTTTREQIDVMSRNAIFLFPSLAEGFGLAALEALAMGMAVVTTQAGLGGDFLVDRHHARIIPAASALHLADAVIELMEHSELREQIAEQGRRLAETLTLDRMICDYERAFEEALQKRRRMASGFIAKFKE